MKAARLYDWLARDGAAEGDFDAHVLACGFALAIVETAWGTKAPLTQALGLEADEIVALARERFPRAAVDIREVVAGDAVVRPDDEACLVDLLGRCAADRSLFGQQLARLIARRAQRPNHLWQDLGLRDRGELSELMRRRFPYLADRNRHDMKWKKFLYRTICRDAAYSLCSAPSCAECDDFAACFGDESGESLLARVRRDVEAHA
jgi:nitrogen fixation protein NifQ